jgi:mannose-6-phosphate isomerase-like protein (cupin superfamily)
VTDRLNLDEQFARFDELWSPKIVGTLNDYDLKIAKVQGEFVWHAHPETDELFLVHRGELRLQIDGRDDVVLRAGEMYVVPRGVRHCPVADETTEIVMLEPHGTLNTGDADGGRIATSAGEAIESTA